MPTEAIRVLLIEDDEDDYVITGEFLAEAQGETFNLKWASTLADGLTQLRNGDFDVILLDLTLPDSHGWRTFVDTHSHAPDVPVILLTGTNDESLGVQAVHQGAQDYLVKGNTTTYQLTRAIRYAIERKRTEAALRKYRNRLEELVRERTAELVEANQRLQDEIGDRKLAEVRLRAAIERLEQHDRAKSQFVSNVSHELRTPLASMSYAIDNMLKGVLGPMPERAVTYLDMLKEDCSRLTGTVTDILDMSRIDSNTLMLNKVKLPFARFVTQVVESLRIQAEAQEHTLTLDTQDGVAFVECDPQKMERVVINIVQNAIKYTPPGGEISVRLHTENGRSTLAVTDNGIGIDEEHIGRVMERYYRVGEHITGTGLGLSLCKDIVELHGGTVDVASPPHDRGNGTRVTVRLQVAASPSILAVDDDEDTLGLLRKQLAVHSYEVDCCGNGQLALDRLQHGVPDIMIIDLRMPVVDGLQLIGNLKAHSEHRQIPVVVITGKEIDSARQEILDGFRIPVLMKPWTPDELYRGLEDAVIGVE